MLLSLLADASYQWGYFGAAFGAGVAAFAAGFGISRIAASANESVARQPEAAGDIRGVTIITAAFIEGVCLFAVVVAMLAAFGINTAVQEIEKKNPDVRTEKSAPEEGAEKAGG